MMWPATNRPTLFTERPDDCEFAGSRPYPGLPRGRARRIWLTTFTDLTALMLTFFVLQFSMSKIDEVQWRNLSDSLQQRLSSVQETQVPLPREVLGIEPRQTLPGDDPAYLTAVIGAQLAMSGAAEDFKIEQRGARVVIRFLMSLEEGRDEDGWASLEVLAALITRLDNRVELEFRPAPAGGAAMLRNRYHAALDSALAMQGRLAAMGVRNLSAVKARLSHPGDGEAPDGARLSIIIHAHAEAEP